MRLALLALVVCSVVVDCHIANHLFGGKAAGSHHSSEAGGSVASNDLDEALKYLPKVELHAHLHGSIRKETLVDIASTMSTNSSSSTKLTLEDYDHITADTPFALFPIIHQLITTLDQVKRILIEMMDDYRQQGTIYLEIRSTPRGLSAQVSISDYLQTLVNTIGQYNIQHRDEIIVKLVVSIDRSKNYKNSMEIIQLAEQYAYYEQKSAEQVASREKVIVGIDFSGNPLGGRFPDFAEIFTTATKRGFNTTVHTAELKELSESNSGDGVDETTFILSFKPDRLGHMLYLKDNHIEQLKQLQTSGKPPLIEICPSTAFTLMALGSYADHPHIRKLASLHYPFSLATDDSGIFNTNLTQEIKHMATAIEFTLPDLVLIQATSLEYAFVNPEERKHLEQIFQQQVVKLKENFPTLMEQEEKDKMDMSSLYTM